MRRTVWMAAALVGGAAWGSDSWAGEADTERPAYWGHPSVDGGKCCATLSEVRANIDRIDRTILAAMAERGRYVAEAGRFKKDPAAVSDPARVAAIVARVGWLAEAEGLAPEVAQKTWAAMIAAFEDEEREAWRKAHPATP
jgi:isochorismate pyruvate lyase